MNIKLKISSLTAGLSIFMSLTSMCYLTVARETNWLEVTPFQSSNRIFIDVDSIKRQSVTKDVKYKIRYIYNRPTPNGVVRSNSTYIAYCAANMQRLIEYTTYNKSNRIVQSITYGEQTPRGDFRNLEAHVEQVTPESVSYTAFKLACSR